MSDTTRVKPGFEFVQKIHKIMFGKESPALNEVCIDGLCMDATEVTNALYSVVTGRGVVVRDFIKPYDKFPVVYKTHGDAQKFCEKIGKRLPTAAEWEKFAPAGTVTPDGTVVYDKEMEQANRHSNGPQNVASYMPDKKGMYDMIGNVMEWVVRFDGTRDIKGGSWGHDDTPTGIHSLRGYYFHWNNDPNADSEHVGFRCVSGKDSKK